jgi:hypothetical protein
MRWIRSNRDEAIRLTADELKVNPKTAMELINELSNTGALNIKGLDNALNLRNQFGLTPPMGPHVSKYDDTQYYQAAVAK